MGNSFVGATLNKAEESSGALLANYSRFYLRKNNVKSVSVINLLFDVVDII